MKKSPNLCCTLNKDRTCPECHNPVCKDHVLYCTICTPKKVIKNIKIAILQDGEYSHNICSASLRIMSRATSVEEANKLIDKFDLTRKYGIHKI